MTANRVAELWKTVRPGADAADADLLARFAAGRDGEAFRELVRRHGPLVFGVCRRVAGHAQDAEDAFQAAFLTLARKAGSVRRPELLGNWLYGVVRRVARRAKRAAARRRVREVQVPTLPDPPTLAADGWADLAPVLDEELAALPEWYRAAVLLCDVQGLSRAEAAGRLGVPEGTVSSRLNAGRKKLADRLTKRGITLSAAGLAVSVAANGTATVPERLFRSAVEAVVVGAVSTAVGELAKEGVWPMRTKLAGLVTAGALAAVGWAALAGPGDPPKPADPPNAKAEKPAEKPGAPEAGLRYKAKMTRTVDMGGQATSLYWHPTRNVVAVVTSGAQVHNSGSGDKLTTDPVIRVFDLSGDRGRVSAFKLAPGSRPVGWSGDGLTFVSETRESGLINSINQLEYWTGMDRDDVRSRPDGNPFGGGKRPAPELPATPTHTYNKPERTCPLEADGGSVYSFRPGAKTFLNDFREERPKPRAEFREHDTETGDIKRTVFAVDGGFSYATVSPDGKRVFTWGHAEDTSARLWDIEGGKQLWSRPSVGHVNRWGAGLLEFGSEARFTQDGTRIAVIAYKERMTERGKDPPPSTLRILDAATGNEVTAFEAAPGAHRLCGFSYNGRLLAVQGHGGGKAYLRVIEVATGRVVRHWDGQHPIVEFSPTDRFLAVVEEVVRRRSAPDQTKSRLGLWEFARDFSELK